MAERPLNIRGLLPFVPTAENQEGGPSDPCVVDPIARAPVDAKLPHAAAQRLAVTKIARGQAIHPGCDFRLRPGITQPPKPLVEDVLAGAGQLVPNLNQLFHCNL